MEALIETLSKFGPGVFVPLGGFAIVGILAQWSLYDKCGQPGIDCIIPVKNVITFLKIVGRPAKHSLWIIIPPLLILGTLLLVNSMAIKLGLAALFFIPWAYFMIKIYIELCQCFGHFKTTDYIICVVLNGFYVLHLGLSYGEKYKGPVYGKENFTKKDDTLKTQVAA